MRVNHDYDRRGALAYLAAYDVGRARVFGRCAASTGIKPFMALVTQVMTREPYASATRVFWIVDNGSSHRGQAAIDRLAKRFPNAWDASLRHQGRPDLGESARFQVKITGLSPSPAIRVTASPGSRGRRLRRRRSVIQPR